MLLAPGSPPLTFQGETAPYAESQEGDTRDLNLMVRRNAGTGGMQHALVDDEWPSAAPSLHGMEAGPQPAFGHGGFSGSMLRLGFPLT